MEVVPSLCATGTLGVAAVGYAFGRPETTNTRPQTTKRRIAGRIDNDFRSLSEPLKPIAYAQTNSAPPSRASKPATLRRPQSASFARNISGLGNSRVSSASIQERDDWRTSLFNRQEDSIGHNESLDFPGSAIGTAKSSWLKRMSTFTLSQGESPTSTPRPSTPSISFSNGSSAPFIPTDSSPMIPRNRLVKRSTSHRMLHSSNTPQSGQSRSQMPILRRPATSYQRSAELQQQYFRNEMDETQDPPRPSYQALDDSTLDENITPNGDSVPIWRPYFRSRTAKVSRDTFSRNGTIRSNRNDAFRCVASVKDDLPTLLKATSISGPAADKALEHSSISTTVSRPLTPAAINPVHMSAPDSTFPEYNNDKDSKRRTSFSISDIFPSSSTSMWKMPRTTSLRRKKGSESTAAGRRIASAPLPSTGGRRASSYIQSDSVHTRRPARKSLDSNQWLGSHEAATLQNSRTRAPSSPLPAPDRLSDFEVNLPYTLTSYPSSPHPQPLSSPSSQISTGVFPSSQPHVQPTSRTKPHRPSGAPSDHASTVGGSDNDNSRVFTVDGDEVDYQSETVYDSLRTDATGSSHSGVRGTKIENVFETSSPHSELLRKNLAELQERLTNNTHVPPNVHQDLIAEEEESVHTPLGLPRATTNDVRTTPRHPSQITDFSNIPSSPPLGVAIEDGEDNRHDLDDNQPDEEWFIDENDFPTSHSKVLTNSIQIDDHSSPVLPSRQSVFLISTDAHTNHEDIEENDLRPRSNVLEWSERSLVEKDSQQGSSPRPKTLYGNQGKERGSRASGRRGGSGLHLRSQSVPLPPDTLGPRGLNNTSKLDAWMLGGKGVSEDWDSDFDFDESIHQPATPDTHGGHKPESRDANKMLVPRSIMDRQASVHGQFGQVKELTLLVEELKILRHQASLYDLVQGQSSELWKEAEGIINLATVDDEDQDFLPPRSPSFDFDAFDDENSPSSHQRRRTSSFTPPRDEPSGPDTGHTTPLFIDPSIPNPIHNNPSPIPRLSTPIRTPNPPSTTTTTTTTTTTSRPRKESLAKAKSVLETIHQHRTPLDPDPQTPHKKLPFDTTSLRDLVTRAGVVTRALKEIVRRAENSELDAEVGLEKKVGATTTTPPDPAFSRIFQQGGVERGVGGSRGSPRSAKREGIGGYLGAGLSKGEGERGGMKMMTVV